MNPASQVVFEFRSIIAASPETVFWVISDPRSKLLWVPAIRSVELESDTPIGLGTHYLTSAGFGPLEFVFHEQTVEWVENQRVAYGGKSKWGKFMTEVNIEPHEIGASIDYRMDYVFPGGIIGSWIGRILTLMYRKGIEAGTAARFKRVVENSPWPPMGE